MNEGDSVIERNGGEKDTKTIHCTAASSKTILFEG
jgi:hypothetical protein